MSRVRVLYDFKAEAQNELTAMTGEELSVLNPNVFEGWIEVRNSRGMSGIVPSTYVEFLQSNDSDDDIPPPPPSTYGFSPNSNSNVPSWNMPSPSATYVNQNNLYQNNNKFLSQTLNDQTQSYNSNDLFSNNISEDNWDVFNDSTANTNTATNTTTNNNNTPADPSFDPFGDTTFNSNTSATSYNSNPPPPSYNSAQPNTQSRKNPNYDDDDSDGFSDDETPGNSTHGSGMNQSNSFYNNNSNNTANTNNNSNFNRGSSITAGSINAPNAGTVSRIKAKNSYGLDVFLLHGAVKTVLDSEKISSIILNEQRQSVWKRESPPYQIEIIGYHSDKKYHGVKKFTSYEIQAKIFPQKVKRRYNHFDWLHERLVEKYPNICIPPLPSKAVTGNFEDEFIKQRKAQLELWLNRMSSHPVVGQSEVFVHFLQCDDASSKWKAGKRKAEKDEYRASQWFCTLTVPGESVDTTNGIKERVDRFAKATNNLDNSVKNVGVALEKIASLNSISFKKEYCGLGKRLEELGLSLNNDALDATNNAALATALVTAGNTYTQIGNMYGEQAKTDIGPLLDRFQLYRGVIQQMPDIVQFEKNAIQTYEEFAQRPEKLEGRNLMDVAPRRELISHVTFAEINLFNKDKVDDFNQCMKTFLQQQINFYTDITECLKRAYSNFEKIPSSNYSSPNYRK